MDSDRQRGHQPRRPLRRPSRRGRQRRGAADQRQTNVYVYNIQTGALSLASVNMAGTAGGNGGSGIGTFYDFPGGLSFSAERHEYLAFRSLATDLTPNVTTANRNLYVRNLDAGTTQLVTPNLAGTDGGDGDSDVVSSAVFSADGQFIAFEDTAGNLVAGDNNGQQDVFVRDLTAATTALASVRSPALARRLPGRRRWQLASRRPSVSADGQYVAFTSDVFYGVHDLRSGSRRHLLQHVLGQPRLRPRHADRGDSGRGPRLRPARPSAATIRSSPPTASYVAFVGYTNLLPAGITATNVHDLDIYVRDLQTNTTTLVSVDRERHPGRPGRRQRTRHQLGRAVRRLDQPRISARWPAPSPSRRGTITSSSCATWQTGTNYLVNHDFANDGHAGNAQNISLSSDGQFVLFTSNDGGPDGQRQQCQLTTCSSGTAPPASSPLVSVNFAGTGPGNADLRHRPAGHDPGRPLRRLRQQRLRPHRDRHRVRRRLRARHGRWVRPPWSASTRPARGRQLAPRSRRASAPTGPRSPSSAGLQT